MAWLRAFLKALTVIVLPLVMWGFVCPAMVNSQEDILVTAGFLTAWLVPAGILALIFWACLEIPAVRNWWEAFILKITKK